MSYLRGLATAAALVFGSIIALLLLPFSKK